MGAIRAATRGGAVRDGSADRARDVVRRAMFLWPRLDARALSRCRHDPRRIAACVARRSSLPPDSILAMLTGGGP